MNKDIRWFILGRVRIARKRLEHDLRTHFGLATEKRHVAEDVCMSDLRSRHQSDAPEHHLELAKRRAQVETAIFDFTNDRRYRELVRRRLFHKECIKDLAKEFGVPYQSARRKVSRARAFIRERLS